MALTSERKTEILNIVNKADFLPSPELKQGDIIWYPMGKENIKAGVSLKMVYNSSNKWEEYSDQTHTF
tara:strand:- start:43 stop:246 length:204 start_codon:yes stop_codon:yes gene_type:complete